MNPHEFEDFFDFDFGVGGVQVGIVPRPFRIRYSRTSESHIVALKLREDVKKEDIKVRLREGGVLEVEWPRKGKAETIEVE